MRSDARPSRRTAGASGADFEFTRIKIDLNHPLQDDSN
jgi:hypothetical protein